MKLSCFHPAVHPSSIRHRRIPEMAQGWTGLWEEVGRGDIGGREGGTWGQGDSRHTTAGEAREHQYPSPAGPLPSRKLDQEAVLANESGTEQSQGKGRQLREETNKATFSEVLPLLMLESVLDLFFTKRLKESKGRREHSVR